MPFERIRLLQGDSDELITGGGTGGSRSAAASSMAMVAAIAKVIEQGKAAASHALEAATADIEFAGGRFTIAGTDRSIGIMDLAARVRAGRLDLPDDAPKSLDVKLASEPVPATTNPLGIKGCGEAGCAGALVSVVNAIIDALSEYGVRHIDMPATPERVWQAIRAARAQT